MNVEFEINDEFEKLADAIYEITIPVLEQITVDTYASLLRPYVCGIIHQLILEGKIKLC